MLIRYPSYLFLNNPERGKLILPMITLPERYERLVREFYRNGGRKEIETFAKDLESIFNIPEIRLRWNKRNGLTNITIPPSQGLDLDPDSLLFIEHNLSNSGSLITGAIAITYASKLFNK